MYATNGTETVYSSRTHEFSTSYIGVCIAQSVALSAVAWFFVWPMYCLTFLDQGFLITPLVPSNFYQVSYGF